MLPVLQAEEKCKYELMGSCGQQRFLQETEGEWLFGLFLNQAKHMQIVVWVLFFFPLMQNFRCYFSLLVLWKCPDAPYYNDNPVKENELD